MTLKYINYFTSQYKYEVKKIYQNAFPREERFPFWVLKCCAKEKNVRFNVILDGGKLVGMVYIIHCENYTYLMFFAIEKSQRKKGYGSQILKDLTEQYKNIILSIEKPDEKFNDDKAKRKNFYLKNGLQETNKFMKDNGVLYELLCTNKEFVITEEKLRERYTKMTHSAVMKWIMSKLFNVHRIDFIEE